MTTEPMFAIMWCFFGSALVLSQTATQQQPQAEKQTTASAIPGVVAAGTKVERVWTGLRSADGLISEPDGTLLLPEQRANRISRVDRNGKITPYLRTRTKQVESRSTLKAA